MARVGGITPWLKVAHLAEAFNVAGVPALPDGAARQPRAAVPNGRYVEHIPQLRAMTRTEMAIEDGQAVAPAAPGSASTGTGTRSTTFGWCEQ